MLVYRRTIHLSVRARNHDDRVASIVGDKHGRETRRSRHLFHGRGIDAGPPEVLDECGP